MNQSKNLELIKNIITINSYNMSTTIEACQCKDLDRLKSCLNGAIDLERCLKTCIDNDFSEGLRFILENIHKHLNPIQDYKRWLSQIYMIAMGRAIKYDRIECVHVFLDHQCDPSSGTCPPVFSLRSIEMANILLSYGADINVVSDICDDGCSLFEIICKRLARSYHDINHEKCKYSSIYTVSDSGALIWNSDAQLILFLIDHGLTPHIGMSVRDILSDMIMQYNFDALQFFVDELHFDIKIMDFDGENLLFDAIMSDNVRGVMFLLERGIENCPNNEGQTPLEFALSKGADLSVVKKIVELISLYEVPVKDPGID